MKTKISLLIVLLIVLTTVYSMRNVLNKNITVTEVTIMRDITDTHISQPNLSDVSFLLNLDNAQWDGASFRFVDITDVSYNHAYEARIDAENQWLGNEFERGKKVKKFYNEITQILTKAETESDGKEQSSVYLPIALELNRLSQSTAQKRTILIYSDLTENTEEFSLYKKFNINLLKTNPDTVQKHFNAQAPLKNLAGIKVYLIYQPTNREADEQYKVIAGFYQRMFENKGASVEITANIN